MNEHFLVCSCKSSEHIVRFMYDAEDKELYMEVQLSQYQNVFKRFLVAIKYILGYKSKYEHWDAVLVSTEEAKKLNKFLYKFSK